jgi:hypothetical protein
VIETVLLLPIQVDLSYYLRSKAKKMDLKTKPVILYLAHGAESVCLQTVFSILTLYYHAGGKFTDFSVVLYTDNSEFFRKYFTEADVAIEKLTKEQIVDLMGAYAFVHRVKTLVIKNCFAKYNRDILYLDGDTMFLKNPASLLQEITSKRSIMNSDEYDMQDGGIHELQHWFDLRTAIRANTFTLHAKAFKIPLATRMWNAGVLGISYSNAPLLDDIVDLTDQLYAKCPLFNVEQFATSFLLQTTMEVISTGDCILHYCYGGVKRTLTYHLGLFFEQQKHQSLKELTQLAFDFSQNLDALTIPPVVTKELTLMDRALLRLQLIKEVTFTGRLQNKWS